MGRVLILFLITSCFSSALAVVYSTHQSRKLFVELQLQQKFRDDLDVEWGRLQLEQSTFATHGNVEMVAREKLGMGLPKRDAVVIVKP
jgi:cell division protein FtsL